MLPLLLLVLVVLPVANADQLLLVHAVWRHGDRSPTSVCPKDVKNAESTWIQGFGQLSELGMRQHYQLGSMIYEEYVKKENFLNKTYQSNEIYIRSTDSNRTIISAMANMIGMYSNHTLPNVPLWPQNAQWPAGFLPVPVHSVASTTDRIGHPGKNCKRDSYLFKEMLKCPEVINYLESVKNTLANDSAICGRKLDAFSLWIASDCWQIEDIHNRTKIFTKEQYDQMKKIDDKAVDFVDAINLSSCDGINLHVEIPRVRGGPILWDIINRIDFKLNCMKPENAHIKQCRWINGLKYYVYSAHDDTITSLLAALGAKHKLIPEGYPQYTATVLIELWNTTKGPQIKMKYRNGPDQLRFENATNAIEGCNNSDDWYCSYDIFKDRSTPYNPGNITKLCDDVPYVAPSKPNEYFRWDETEEVNMNQVDEAEKDPLIEGRNDSEDSLLFLQMVWRHGDRNPKWLCKNDPNNASTWVEGLGQLTPTGMDQQRRLGALIFDNYAMKQNFLSKRYESNEMYIRSTDVNRTLLSAVSNLVGMYFNRPDEKAGLDYPLMNGWPSGYVPIAVHTIKKSTDHFSFASPCPRRAQLEQLILQSDEVQKFLNENQETFKQASDICGQKLDIFSVFYAVDACTSEAAHNRSCIFPKELLEKMHEIDEFAQDIRKGRLNQTVFGGVNVSTEMPRLLGGSLLWSIIDHMEHKVYCTQAPRRRGCKWMNTLKYFAYSAHDSTIQALLATFVDRKLLYPFGIPEYAAAVAIELWNTKNGYLVKVRLNRGHADNRFVEITDTIKGCPQNASCTLDVFKARSQCFNPGDIVELCNTPLESITSTTTITTTMPESTTSTAATVSPVHKRLGVIMMWLTILLVSSSVNPSLTI